MVDHQPFFFDTFDITDEIDINLIKSFNSNPFITDTVVV